MRERQVPSALAQRIDARLEALGLNPLSAAKKAGLGDDFVRDILRGKVRNPSAVRLGRLAEALETSLRYLLGEDESITIVHKSPGRDDTIEPPPPEPLPVWQPDDGVVGAFVVPIRFELMADTWRKATEVTRKPLGFEATSVPVGGATRPIWWELVRDDSVAAVAPPGSLVLVAEYNDDERDLIADGEFVIVQRRFLAPDAAFHLVERSMRRVRYRYPDLGLWFLDYAHIDPDLDASDDIWKEQEPTAPRKTLHEYADEIEDPDERAAAHAQNQLLLEAIEKARARVSQERVAEVDRVLNDPGFADQIERMHKWNHKLVGKVLRVLSPLSVDGAIRFK